jgi:hypothetical protein
MRRGARILVFALAAVLLAATAAAAITHINVRVRPGSGSPATRFSVRFTAPDSAGTSAAMRREYVVNATGPNRTHGCVDGSSRAVGHARAGARIRVTLRPQGGGWCAGTFHGTIEELEMPVCPKGELCPAFAVLLRRLGHFRFVVRTG